MQPSAKRVARLHAARVPTSDPVQEVVRAIIRRVEAWWRSPAAKRAWRDDVFKWEKYTPDTSFEDWVEMFRVENPDYTKKGDAPVWISAGEDGIALEIARQSHFPGSEPLIEWLPGYMKKRGWFLKTHTTPGGLYHDMTFEARRGKRVRNLPRKLWHITPWWNADKILRKGILPKSRGGSGSFEAVVLERKYPDRIYLGKGDPAPLLNAFMWRDSVSTQGIESAYYGGREPDPYVVFQVDTAKVGRANFYEDPDYRQGFYTYTPIPPAALSLDAASAHLLAEIEGRP